MLEKLFGFDPSKMTLRKEVIGGITTFLTMAYILAVNPSILSATGMDAGAVFTTTCISAVVATLVMALYAKLPFVLAPGMGLNAFFAFTVVLTMGYSCQFALTAVMIEDPADCYRLAPTYCQCHSLGHASSYQSRNRTLYRFRRTEGCWYSGFIRIYVYHTG